MSVPTFIEIKYDNFAVDEGDRESLSRIFSKIAPTRVRDAFIERGGVDVTVSVTLAFVGTSVLGGIIWDLIKFGISRSLDGFKEHLEERRVNEPEYLQTLSLVLSFDDIDVAVNVPLDSSPSFIRHLLETVALHLNRSPLKSYPLNRIHIPMVREDDSDLWMEGLFWSSAEFLDRYWGLAFMSSPHITGVYDSENGCTVDGAVM